MTANATQIQPEATSSAHADWRSKWDVEKYGQWPHPGPPTLVIVMGVSGSGKSTLGSSLSRVMGQPFIDGDDLHPASNVAKMSAGTPLNDDDRLPWLQKIRSTAIDVLCYNKGHSADDKPSTDDLAKRKLAEALETSAQAHRDHDHLDPAQAARDAKREAQAQGSSTSAADTADSSSSSSSAATTTRPAAVFIACSALKVKYRDLLRGQQADDPLRTLHLYVKIPHQELRRRIHERKGHWMKEEMLNSQLATLEEPDEQSGEQGIIVEPEIGQGMDELVQRCVRRLTRALAE